MQLKVHAGEELACAVLIDENALVVGRQPPPRSPCSSRRVLSNVGTRM